MRIIRDVPPEANEGEPVAIDLELFGMKEGKLHRDIGRFACASICMARDPEIVYMIFDPAQVWVMMGRLKKARQIYHNALFDLRQIRRWARVDDLEVWDTMIVEKDLWGGYFDFFSLADLVRRYLNVYMEKETRENFATAEYMTEEMIEYSGKDAWYTLQVYYCQKALEDAGRNLRCYHEIDMPSIWAFLDMPPVKVDVEAWRKALGGFTETAKQIEAELGFNTMSPNQVKKAFLEREKRSLASTGAEVLAVLDSPLARRVLECRSYRKNVSTYGDKWLEEALEPGDLVYAAWSVVGAQTGRTACQDPNLQNIPSRKFPIYRTFFVPQHGEFTITDVSAQEPRFLAHLSGDKELKRIFVDKEDPHAVVARAIFNDPTIKKGDFRRDKIGKKINLGTSYGLTAAGLMNSVNEEVTEDLRITEEQAEKFLKEYFKKFPGVDNYIRQTRIMAERQGYVETITGRRIWMNTHTFGMQNECINAPIQGGAGDFSKLWNVKYRQNCKREHVPFPVCLFVHDELVSDHTPEMGDLYRRLNDEAFQETAAVLVPGIPFEKSTDIGSSWAAKH
jgi:DNA polymerase I